MQSGLPPLAKMPRFFGWLCMASVVVAFQSAGAEELIQQIRSSTPEERAQAQAEVLADVLDLDAVQTEQLVEINLKYSNRVQQLVDRGVEDTVVFVAIQGFAGQKDDEIKTLLTNEQIRRYEAYKRNLRKIIEDVIQNRNR